MNCTGPCDQGRKLCPTPHACGIAAPVDEDAPQQDIFRVVLSDLAIAAALVGAVLMVLWGAIR